MTSGTDEKRREALRVLLDCDLLKKYGNVGSVSAKEAAELGDKVLFVDVRSKQEFLTSAIPNAIHSEEFEAMLKHNNAQLENSSVVCFYCTIGVRSAKYILWLKTKNFEQLSDKNLLNLKGSIVDWSHEPMCATLVKPSNDKVAVGPLASEIHCFGDRWDLASTKYKPRTFRAFEQMAEGARWIFC